MKTKYNLLVPDTDSKNNKNPLNNQKTYVSHQIIGKMYNKKVQTIDNNLLSYQQRQHLFFNKKNNREIIQFLNKNCLIDNVFLVEDIFYYKTYIILLLKLI